MPSYKHIIFDIDGTLIDTEEALLISLQDTLKDLDQEVKGISELRFVLGIPGETALERLGLADPASANMLWNEHLERYKNKIKLFEGIEDLITKLHSTNYQLGLITSKNRYEFENDFIPTGLAGNFRIVICSDESKYPKPSPYPMLTYLEKAGISNKEALYIGDTDYDRQCASGAGVDFGLAVWGCGNPDALQANYRFALPGEILSFLQIQEYPKIP
jgi:HAD superfamily hydrolase (TIGR01549 family)